MGKNPTRKIDGALVVYHKDLSLVGNATRETVSKSSEQMLRKGDRTHKVRGKRMHRTENGPAMRSGWAWPGLTRYGYSVGVHLALFVVEQPSISIVDSNAVENANRQ